MIRVGFAPALDAGWLGGINYYRNLLTALAGERDRDFALTLFAGRAAELGWVPGDIRIVRSKLLDSGSFPRRMLRRLTGRDVVLGRLTKEIDVLSHAGPLPGRRTIGWIADLQHLHLQELFPDAERRARDRAVAQYLLHCSVVLVSSEAARANLLQVPGGEKARIVVLRFVATPPDLARLPDPAALRAKYSLPERYFYLPNQFWMHKNHRLIIDALRQVRATVVCTGVTRDYRRPGYYQELMGAAAGLESRFRVLGLVPQADAAALMRDAVAVINPSLFEGWSTTVEEAKSLGKRVLLSDIPVHREQAPERSRYFDCRAPDDAAKAMEEALAAFDPAEEASAAKDAAAHLPARRSAFAKTYLGAVRQALE